MIPSTASLLTASNQAANTDSGDVMASASSASAGATAAPPPPPPPPPPDSDAGAHPTHVSEPAYEFLLGSILHWVEAECSVDKIRKEQQQKEQEAHAKEQKEGGGGDGEGDGAGAGSDGGAEAEADTAALPEPDQEELAILSAERAAAKIERLGFDVGYRLCERLAQSKPLGQGLPPPGSAAAVAAGGTVDPAAMQLEAVKFLCKEFWTEVFRKQIDKLQTNHRGVFVLKDHELRWLRRLPPEDETARVAAIKMLAFPCGLIRGALSNLGIAAVVSCDFLADGKNMAACSFNIKIKS